MVHMIQTSGQSYEQLKKLIYLKVGHSRPLFIYFRLFNSADNKQTNVQYKFCQ